MGTAGMPRRIGDYADAFLGWNRLSTAGSYISGFAFMLFGYIISNTIRQGIIATIPNY